jgi:hypothetical protein
VNIYCVISEEWEFVSYDRCERDWGRLAVIVAAENRGQARYLAVQSDREFRGYGPLDWPKMWVKKLGAGLFNRGVLESTAAGRWWPRVGDWSPGEDGQ